MQPSDSADLFIISKDFQIKENEEIKFTKFYDCMKNSTYYITIKDGKSFLCFKQNNFGSVFNGNYVYEQATILIVKEIDPCLLMIDIIYATSKIDSDKFSCLSLNDFIYRYVEELNKRRLDEEVLKSSKDFLNFIKSHFNQNSGGLENICEKTYSK